LEVISSKQKLGGSFVTTIRSLLIGLWACTIASIFSPTEAHAQNTCRATLPFPADEHGTIDLPIIYQGNCPKGVAEGKLSLRAQAEGAPPNTIVEITSTFVGGRATGKTTYRLPQGVTFDGEILSGSVMRGRFEYVDYQTEGEYRNGQLYTGRVFRAASMGGGINYFEQGRLIKTEGYQAPDQPSISPPQNSTLTSITLRGKPCSIDLPSAIYLVEFEPSGKCVDGFYHGKATVKLTPKTPNGYPAALVDVSFIRGLPSGNVKATYKENNEVFRGELRSWLPGSGTSEKNLGNRNYQITTWANGSAIEKTVQYRPPSQTEIALAQALGTVIDRGIDCTIGQCARERKAEKQAVRQSQQVAVLEQKGSQTNTGGWSPAPTWTPVESSSSATTVSDGGMVQSSSPAASNNPDFSVNTNPPLFGGNTMPQGDAPQLPAPLPPPVFGGTTSQPASPQSLPQPQPNGGWQPGQSQWGNGAVWSSPSQPMTGGYAMTGSQPSIPEPTPGIPTPVQQGGVPVSTISAPYPMTGNGTQTGWGNTGTTTAPSPIPSPSISGGWQPGQSQWGSPQPPVQAPTQNDTLGTGQPAPSNPVSQPAVNGPASPNRPAIGANRPVVPSIPTGLYPTNERDELQLSFMIGWQPSTGATHYIVALHDLTAGGFPLNDVRVNGTSKQLENLTPGHSYAWDVQACNASGCSLRSGNRMFRTAGAATQNSPNLARDVMAGATQGTRDCVNALVRETGESVESAYQLVTSAGGWQQLGNTVASSVWNIIRHPILSAKAAWNGLTGQVSGVRDAVNAGNPSLACQRAVKLSANVVGAAEGAQAARATLGNLRRVANDNGGIARGAADGDSSTPTSSRRFTVADYQNHHNRMVAQLQRDLDNQGFTAFKEVSFSGVCQIDGRCRTDLVAHNDRGGLVLIEVKTGAASLSIRQMAIYPQIKDGNAIPVGQIAADLGLRSGTALKHQGYPNGIPILEYRYPGPDGQ
jgi:hypothetical protein